MKTYTAANDSEARSLHDGTQTLVVVPMRQPPTGCVYLMNANGDKACCYYQFSDLGNYTGPCWVPPTPTSTDHLLPAPYTPGDVVGVKEVATDAIRTRLSIVSVAAKRVQEIPGKQIRNNILDKPNVLL